MSSSDRDVVYEGKPARQRDESYEKYLTEKLGQIRSICQWLAGLGIASVFGQLLRATPPADVFNRRAPIVLGAAQVIVSIVGAVPFTSANVDVGARQAYLGHLLSLRKAAMWVALVLLIAALVFLLRTIW